MKKYLQILVKIAAYTAAAIVILLAVAVGLFRLLLPRLPEYQEEIKDWASEAIGMQVEFSGMDALWGLHGPELKFYGAELIRPSNLTRALAASEVGVGVSLIRLLLDRTLVVDTVTVRDTSIEVRQLADGSWRVQGSPVDELLTIHAGNGGGIGSIAVFGDDIELLLIRPGDERPTYFEISNLLVQRDGIRVAVDADIRLPEEIGRDVGVSATRITPGPQETAPWNVSIEADDLNLAGLSDVFPDAPYVFDDGRGDLDLSIAVLGRRIASATADISFEDVSVRGGGVFDIRGRFAYNNNSEGWLVAADQFVLRSADGQWPRSSLRLETSTDRDRNIVMLDARASYLNLADAYLVAPWLADEQRAQLDALRADGIVRDLEATVSDLDAPDPGYSIVAELENVGVAAIGRRPGLRGFTGSLRADHDGGLLEIQSENLLLNLPAWVNEPVEIDIASGTVIWRRSNERTTILSDSIVIRNSLLDSQSNIEVTIDGENSPVIDLASIWSIEDLSVARRFIPEAVMTPKMFLWFQDALLSGQITRAQTRLYGPLDKFPFDDGEGRLLVEASIRDMDFRYNRRFPVTRVSELEVVLDNARLYTTSNHSVSLGNSTIDASVEIPDLRAPVLRVQSFTTGTLDSMRDFIANSPIARVFGGRLDRITVSGEATTTLDLTVPIKDWRSFEFTSYILSNNGSLAIEGLPAPLTELSGAITVERDLISSESLGGRFLGEPITIELRNASAAMPEFRVVASAAGAATATALVEELGVPLEGRLDGRTEYLVDILFPRSGVDLLRPQPVPAQGATEPATEDEGPKVVAPLTVRVNSDLFGLGIDLPLPYGKGADELRRVVGDLRFEPGGERMEVSGRADNDFAWQVSFAKLEENWDFDRGMLVLGDVEMPAADVRGLHIRGHAPRINFEEWLRLSRGNAIGGGAAGRIRSIDLEIDDLYLLGQHLQDHRVRVDRSARDWLVQFDGEEISGSVFVPYDFNSDRALILDMERLVLPGGAGDESVADVVEKRPLDPRTLPSISLKAQEFGLGDRFFGTVEANFERTPAGLQADSIIATDPTFEIVGNGRWEVDETDPMASRSFMTGTLTSSDVEQTMARLGYQPGIISDDMGVLLDISWSGGPRMDFLDTLDGEVQVRLGSGQLDEVEPGAGRMFGLMSIVALPRRLSLDFRDVFQKGFGFDEISGTFRIEDGAAYTCNLSLAGPAADIGIIGRADLVERDYAQAAVVSTNVGNTLPVVGAVVAGPQAAAVMFLFSQIFRKPLQDIGQVYYSVSGSWDEPAIDSADADAFTNQARAAGCLDESE